MRLTSDELEARLTRMEKRIAAALDDAACGADCVCDFRGWGDRGPA